MLLNFSNNIKPFIPRKKYCQDLSNQQTTQTENTPSSPTTPPVQAKESYQSYDNFQKNYFYKLQDMYEGFSNALLIKLPYTIDKATLLNILLFYGKIERIDIDAKTNVIQIEYYTIFSAMKCFSEFKFNFTKLKCKTMEKKENETNENENKNENLDKSEKIVEKNLEISYIKKNFEKKFYLGISICEKELIKTKINTDCVIKVISRAGKILKIYQQMLYVPEISINNKITLKTVFMFNDSRDKEKAEFMLRRILNPYPCYYNNTNNFNNSSYENVCCNLDFFRTLSKNNEESKITKSENDKFNSNDPLNNQTTNNNLISENDLKSFYLIFQYLKTDDDLNDNYNIESKSKEKNSSQKISDEKESSQENNDENKENVNSNNNNYYHNNNKNNYKKRAYGQQKKNCFNREFYSEINKSQFTGIKQRNTPVEERVKYRINLEKIINETDQRTTLMIKNVPRNIMQSFLMDLINKKFQNFFNFFYLPIDFIKKENAGYAFINFKNSKHIVDFYIEFNEKPWPFCKNRKCFISYARIQGFRAITQHFSSSNIMNVDNVEVKPYISDE